MKTKNYLWGTGQRRTVQQAFRWGIKHEPRPTKSVSVSYLRYEREVWKMHLGKPHRDAVGYIRAFGATNFFRGCYEGAEND